LFLDLLWQISFIAQPEQPHPQDDFPARLFLIIFTTISTSATARIIDITAVEIISFIG